MKKQDEKHGSRYALKLKARLHMARELGFSLIEHTAHSGKHFLPPPYPVMK